MIFESGLAPGAVVLDRYRVIGTLGVGQQARTYRARDLHEERDVALKIGNQAAPDGSPLWLSFRGEFESIIRVDHPNMVDVVECGRTPTGHPVLVSKFVAGVTLERYLAGRPCSVEHCRPIFLGITDVLAAAHRLGVVHRDLTPRNVIVRDHGREASACVIDFGLALVGPEEDARHLSGTPGYIPPEQIRGRAEPASDIYSLGALLWLAVTGEPYLAEPEDAPLQTVRRHLVAKRAGDPRSVEPTIGERLAEVIAHCLDPDPARRPSATELLTRLHVAFGSAVDPHDDTANPFRRRAPAPATPRLLRPQSTALPAVASTSGVSEVVLTPLATLEGRERVLLIDIDVPRRERFRGWLEGHNAIVVCAHRLRDIKAQLDTTDLVVLAGDLPDAVLHRFLDWLGQTVAKHDDIDVVVYAAASEFETETSLRLTVTHSAEPDIALHSHYAQPGAEEQAIPDAARFIGELPELILNLSDAIEADDLPTRRWICQHVAELADPVGADDIRAQVHAIAEMAETVPKGAVLALVDALEATYLDFARWNLL